MTKSNKVEEPLRVLTKYPNRRIYDTTVSTYVSFSDIKKLIASGIQFKVLDQKSQEDVTHQVLVQLMAEDNSYWCEVFSEEMLKGIIRLNAASSKLFFGQYLENSLRSFIDLYDENINQTNDFLTESEKMLKFIASVNPLLENWTSNHSNAKQ